MSRELVGVVVPLACGNIEFCGPDDDFNSDTDYPSFRGAIARMGERPLYPKRRTYGMNARTDAVVARDFYTGKRADGTGVPIGGIGGAGESNIGAVINPDPFRGSGGSYNRGGYNVEPYTYLPWARPGFRPLAKYADNPYGDQRVGGIGAVINPDPYQPRRMGDYQRGGYNVEPFTYLPYHGRFTPLAKFSDNPYGDQRVGAVIEPDPYQPRGRGSYLRGGYNAETYDFLPYHGRFTPLAKYDDNAYGEQRVGFIGVGAMESGGSPSADAAAEFLAWAEERGYTTRDAANYGWQSTDNTAHGVVVNCKTANCGREIDKKVARLKEKHGVDADNHELSNAGIYLVVFKDDADSEIADGLMLAGMYDPSIGAIICAQEPSERALIEGGFFAKLKEAFKKKKKKKKKDEDEAEGFEVGRGGGGVGIRRARMSSSPSSARSMMASRSMSSSMSSRAPSSVSQARLSQQAGQPAPTQSSSAPPQQYGGEGGSGDPGGGGYGGYQPPPSYDFQPPPPPYEPPPMYYPAPQYPAPVPQYIPAPQPVYLPPPVAYAPQPVAYPYPTRGLRR